jgi:hypothetical protein
VELILNNIKGGLYERARFPNTVRVKDGALIRILKKKKPNKPYNGLPNSRCFVVTTFASFRNIIDDFFPTSSNKTWISISEKFGLLVPAILFYGKYINKIHVFRAVKKDRLGPVIWSTKEWVHGYLQ